MSKWNGVLEKAHKIRELRDRAGTPEEAAAAAAKLQDLLIKHQIEEYELDDRKTTAKTPVVAVEFDVNKDMIKGRRITLNWRKTVGFTAATAHGCKAVSWHPGSRMTFVGYRTNVDAAIHMFHYLKNTIIDLTLEGYQAHKAECEAHWSEPTSPRKWHTSFAEGAISIIRARLQETRQDAEEAAAKTSTALVVMNEAVEQEFYSLYPNLSKAKRTNVLDVGAYRNGVAAGRAVALGKELGGGRKRLR